MTTAAPSLFIPEREVARLLGHDMAWLRSNAPVLEASTGFPSIDPVIGMRHREAIEEWARERNVRRRSGPERLTETNQRENHDAF
jgi:hypothetical protein